MITMEKYSPLNSDEAVLSNTPFLKRGCVSENDEEALEMRHGEKRPVLLRYKALILHLVLAGLNVGIILSYTSSMTSSYSFRRQYDHCMYILTGSKFDMC